MQDALRGIKVLEVAQFWFVPSAGAMLADWGADVLKVEHPERGDAQRGLAAAGLGLKEGGVDFMMQQSNRGKRSVAIDIGTDEGRELIYELAKKCDVFLTNFLPEACDKLQIDVDRIRAQNPKIVYVRGTGYGAKGEERNAGGYDATAFWARGGVVNGLTTPGAAPPGQRPAFGDSVGALALSSGITAALLKRERTGEPSVVDVSLLGTAMWTMSVDIVASGLLDGRTMPSFDRTTAPSPVVNFYQTKDERWLILVMLQADRYWQDFCTHIERPDLIEDERYANMQVRFVNREACIQTLDETFAKHTLDEWKARFQTLEGPWAPVQKAADLFQDPQVLANEYLREVDGGDQGSFKLVANPVSFDGEQAELTRSPELGDDTDTVLQEELGLSMEKVMELKVKGAIM